MPARTGDGTATGEVREEKKDPGSARGRSRWKGRRIADRNAWRRDNGMHSKFEHNMTGPMEKNCHDGPLAAPPISSSMHNV